MSATALEILLARLYGSPLEVEKFLADRRAYASSTGLPAEQWPEVLALDAQALRFAARSYERKRGQR